MANHDRRSEDGKPYLRLFLCMFHIGFFTFGGGLSMIPQMKRVLCDKHGWVDETDLLDYFAIGQTLPGAIAINTAILIGCRMAGSLGAVVALLGAVLPSFLVLLGVTLVYELFITNAVMLGVLRGVRAAVTALLFASAWQLRRGALKDRAQALLCAAALCLVLFLDASPVWILLGTALWGLLGTLRRKRREGQSV